jgi:hypothetical protein
LATGLLIGAATAVKAPFILVGIGVAWGVRRSPRLLAVFTLGAAAVLIPGYLLISGRMTHTFGQRSQVPSPAYSWRLISELSGWKPSPWFFSWGVPLVALAIAIAFMRGLPRPPKNLPGVHLALALSLAWVIATPLFHSWYDVMFFPLLALLPASPLDWIVVVRALAGAIGFVPGAAARALHPAWLETALKQIVFPYVTSGTLLTCALLLIGMCLLSRSSLAADERGTPRGMRS